jgi:hypothetical protein
MSNLLGKIALAAGLTVLSMGSLASMTAPASAQGWNRGDDYRGDYYRGDDYRGGYYRGGTYLRTCRNIQMSGGMLTADCADRNGRYRQSTIRYTQCRGDIGNRNGLLNCNGATAREAYGQDYGDWRDRAPYNRGYGGEPWTDYGRY